jgi:hypothetical protein
MRGTWTTWAFKLGHTCPRMNMQRLVANPPVKLENVPSQDFDFNGRLVWLVDSAWLL